MTSPSNPGGGTDFSAAVIPGPWEHLFISANGARFHVAEAGPREPEAPLVVLLHGFPQFWYAWRHQLAALADAGYRTVAMDLRGYAASDKPPEGHTLPGLARDVTAVIGSLGAPSAVVVGQGFGGLVAWTMAVSCPQSVRAIAVFDAPHPASSQRRALWVSPRAAAQIAGLRLPALRDELARRHDVAGHALTTWSAPGWPDEATLGLYREVMGIPFAQSKAIEQIRWAAQTRASREHRRFLARFERPPALPVLHVQGVYDGLFRTSAMACPELAGGDYRFERVFDAGHFVPEEAPDRATELLLGWLGRVAA